MKQLTLKKLIILIAFFILFSFPDLASASESDVVEFAKFFASYLGKNSCKCEFDPSLFAYVIDYKIRYARDNGGKMPTSLKCISIELSESFDIFKQRFDEFLKQHKTNLRIKYRFGWQYRKLAGEIENKNGSKSTDKLEWHQKHMSVNGTPTELDFDNTGLIRIWFHEK